MWFIFSFLILLLSPLEVGAKCVNSTSYNLKGYIESADNTPVIGKTLSEVLFDVFYDDSTSSTGNAATAEMGQGWYRYSYTSNGKSGIWVVRDSTSTYRNFPGGILEQLCDSQLANYDSTGGVTIQDGTSAGQIDTNAGAIVSVTTTGTVTTGVTLANDAITPASIQAGALGGASETYLATGTENASQTSTATRVYTALSNNTRRYMSMCLENGTTLERSKIVGYGSSPANYFDVRGFSAAVGDSVTLNVHTTGCQ